MSPISLGKQCKSLSPRHRAELSSLFLVRVLMSCFITPFGFFTGMKKP